LGRVHAVSSTSTFFGSFLSRKLICQSLLTLNAAVDALELKALTEPRLVLAVMFKILQELQVLTRCPAVRSSATSILLQGKAFGFDTFRKHLLDFAHL